MEKVKKEDDMRGKSAMTKGAQSASMQQLRISSAVSQEDTMHIPGLNMDGSTKIDWHEQRKLLRKRQVGNCEQERRDAETGISNRA